MLISNSKSPRNHVVSPEEEKERMQWEGFAGKEGFKVLWPPKGQFAYLTREGGVVGEATTVVGGASVCRQQCHRLYSCLSDCIKKVTWREIFMWAKKTERGENERGWRSDTRRNTCLSVRTSPLVAVTANQILACLLYTSPSPRD